jgi:thiol-disulfide isomerase/thioredoxin
MSGITLEPDNYASLSESLTDDSWIVACLCAAWCNACRDYRPGFFEAAERHPNAHFVWIDIEDQADVVGELDVDNFPTLLIQRGDLVTFYSPVHPDARQAERLLLAQSEQSVEELKRMAFSDSERAGWQENCNLRALLRNAISTRK